MNNVDYFVEAKASLDSYYEHNQPLDNGTFKDEYSGPDRLLESIAESLVSIADSLCQLTGRKR